jgi:hypothetical protein
MSENQATVEASTTDANSSDTGDKAETLVDFVFDLGTEWAAYGLETGRNALEQSARTLEKLASTLASVRKQLLAKA